MLLICVYRLQEISFSFFIDELSDLFETYIVLYESCIIAGDFNVHVDETHDPSCTKFHELLDLFDLTQHIHEATHIMGHTLDLVISRVDDPLVDSVVVTQHDLSHHFLVNFEINIKPQSVNNKTITFRNIKKINSQQLRSDITASYATIPENLNFADTVTNYNKVMLDIIDKHAPVRSKTVKVVPRAPWFDTEYATLRRLRRKAEKKYKRTGNEEDKLLFHDLRKQTTTLAMHKKQSYISGKLMAGNRSLYSVVDELLDNGKEVVLPTAVSDLELANNFRHYFSDKVNKIRASITPSSSTKIRSGPPPTNVTPLAIFKPATLDEIKSIVMSYTIKCSPEDPIPACILKQNVDIFIPYWLDIVNLSLQMGTIDALKSAVIFTLIKEMGS